MANYNNILARISDGVPQLNNASAASVWRRMAAVFASVIDVVQLEMSRSERRIQDAARNLRVMGKQFYIDTAFAYQEGDALMIVDPETLREGYASVDPAKQIIKQAAIEISVIKQIYVKVATTDASDALVPLTPTQLAGFQSYMARFTPVGMELTVFSAEPDIFNATHLYVRYSPEYSLTAIQEDLLRVMKEFRSTFNPDIPLYINDVEAALKTVTGIRDAWFEDVTAAYTDAEGSHTTTPDGGMLELNAGYFNFDPAIYDWDSGITIFTAV